MEEIIKELKEISEAMFDEKLYAWSDQIDETIDKIKVKSNRLEKLVTKSCPSNGAVADTSKLNSKFIQCMDCHHNWNFIGKQFNGWGKGWCYMFSDFTPDCSQKQKINDYR